IDVEHDVLLHGFAGPEEFTGRAVDRVEDAGLARNAGDDLADFTRLHVRADPLNLFRVWRNVRIDENTFKRMIEVPLTADVLLVPDDLTSIGIDGEGRGLIEVLSIRIIRAHDELGIGRGHRGTGKDQVQL